MRVCVSCGASIFNRAFHCFQCEPDAHQPGGNGDVCLDCVAEGRGCGNPAHFRSLAMAEHLPLHTIRSTLNDAVLTFTNVCFYPPHKHATHTQPAQQTSNKQAQVIQRSTAVGEEQKQQWIEQAAHPRPTSARSLASAALLCVKRASASTVETCHLCGRTVHISKAVTCSNSGCRAAFCAVCLWHTFCQRFVDALRQKHWECPRCTRSCPCPSCVVVPPSLPPLPQLPPGFYPQAAAAAASTAFLPITQTALEQDMHAPYVP